MLLLLKLATLLGAGAIGGLFFAFSATWHGRNAPGP